MDQDCGKFDMVCRSVDGFGILDIYQCARPRSLLIVLLIVVSGCAGIAMGVMRVNLECSAEGNTSACYFEGPSSEGLEALMREQENERAAGNSTRVLEVLLVHGVSRGRTTL